MWLLSLNLRLWVRFGMWWLGSGTADTSLGPPRWQFGFFAFV
jgi:hypothetical protein